MRDLLILAVVFGALLFSVRGPFIALLVWAWIGYMNIHQYGWAAREMPLVFVAAVVTIVGYIFTKDKNKFPITSLTFVWLMLVLWMSFTTYYLLNYTSLPVKDWQLDNAKYEWTRMIKIQVMMLMTLLLVTDYKKLNTLVWVIFISIGFYGIKGGFFTLLTGGQFLVWGPPNSFIEGNNEIAFALLIIVPLGWYLYTETSKPYIKKFILISLLFICVSIVGSYSRGALLGASAMFFYLWFKGPKKIAGLLPMIVFALVGLLFMPETWIERMVSIGSYSEDASALGRINAWWFAYNIANDFPLTGGGFGTFIPHLFEIYSPDPTSYADAHSIYFEILGEHGYVALVLFLAMGILTFLSGRKISLLCKGKDELRWASTLANMLQVSLVGYAVGGAFLGLAYFDLPYHVMAMMVVLREIVKKKTIEIDDSEKALVDGSNIRNVSEKSV